MTSELDKLLEENLQIKEECPVCLMDLSIKRRCCPSNTQQKLARICRELLDLAITLHDHGKDIKQSNTLPLIRRDRTRLLSY